MRSIYATFFTLITLISVNLNASSTEDVIVTYYSNDNGCSVKKEQDKDMITLQVSKENETLFIQYEYKYRFGNFMYCSGDNSTIFTSSGKSKNFVSIFCKIAKNAPDGTRSGIVDMTIDLKGNIEMLQINGMTKIFYEWEQETFIVCNELKKVE